VENGLFNDSSPPLAYEVFLARVYPFHHPKNDLVPVLFKGGISTSLLIASSFEIIGPPHFLTVRDDAVLAAIQVPKIYHS